VTPNGPSAGSCQQDPLLPTGIFAYLLAANALRVASGPSDPPKVALAILAIDANS
jgi:hypothetical protein